MMSVATRTPPAKDWADTAEEGQRKQAMDDMSDARGALIVAIEALEKVLDGEEGTVLGALRTAERGIGAALDDYLGSVGMADKLRRMKAESV